MTITPDVRRQFFVHATNGQQQVIRLPPSPAAVPSRPTRRQGRPWTQDEHDRFLQGLELFPHGPWSVIASHVGTRTTRQTMTHAQKYRQRIARYSDVGLTTAVCRADGSKHPYARPAPRHQEVTPRPFVTTSDAVEMSSVTTNQTMDVPFDDEDLGIILATLADMDNQHDHDAELEAIDRLIAECDSEIQAANLMTGEGADWLAHSTEWSETLIDENLQATLRNL